MRLFARRWPLYTLACVVVFALEVAFYTFVHVRFANFYAELLGSPLISAVVIVNVGADATGTLERGSDRLERIVDRAWAIIVIDVGITLIMRMAFQSMSSSDAGTIFAGVAVMFLGAMLVYAEPLAALEKDVRVVTMVPLALLRSMTLAWVNISRIFSLFAIQIALAIAEIALLRAAGPAGTRTLDAIDLAYVALVTAPLTALFTVAYLDTLEQERRLAR